jgi:Uma2 family endonuclease
MPEVQDGIEEVVDGEIIYTPPAKLAHARISQRLTAALTRLLPEADYEVFTGSHGIVIAERPLTCRNPDITVCERKSLVEKDGYLRSAPQLVVEVISPSETRRMTERKLQDYESIATPEVWIITPPQRSVEVFQLQEERLDRVAILLKDGALKPRAFPHVEIDIAKIWPD